MKYKLGSFENEWLKLEIDNDILNVNFKVSLNPKDRMEILESAMNDFEFIGNMIENKFSTKKV